MDASARITMKDAAKCDKRCEWQNSANQENAERILHFLGFPESMSRSGRQRTNAPNAENVTSVTPGKEALLHVNVKTCSIDV